MRQIICHYTITRITITRLQGLVRRIYDSVPLTRKRMQERGVRPEHIQSLADITLLPFMQKSDLREEYSFWLFVSPMNKVLRFHCSSGTTGKPIVIGNTQNDIWSAKWLHARLPLWLPVRYNQVAMVMDYLPAAGGYTTVVKASAVRSADSAVIPTAN